MKVVPNGCSNINAQNKIHICSSKWRNIVDIVVVLTSLMLAHLKML